MPYQPENLAEQAFLDTYDPSIYPRPSATADIVIFTIDNNNQLQILLIKRRDYPYKNYWALPGGFLNAGTESLERAAERELQEETGITNAYLKQLYTFSDPDRDPRTHVISTVYTALIPKDALKIQAGDDAADAQLFTIRYDKTLTLYKGLEIVRKEDLAFDHYEIIRLAIERLRGRISYEPDAFELLKDKRSFTIYELKKIFEAINNKQYNGSNFQKIFNRSYIKTGKVVKLDQTRKDPGHRAASLYKLLE